MQNLSETEYAAVKDEVWNNMVRKSLIEKQAKAIGLTVTDEELQYVIETGSSPLLASTPFGNEMTGEFDVDYLRSFLSSYNEMDRTTVPAEYLDYYDNLYNFWLYLEDNIKFDLLASKYMSIVENSIISNPVSQKNSYEARMKRADVQLAALPYSSVDDSEITVTKADIKKLYDERKEMLYQIAESRDLLYIDYEIVPSQADRNALLAEVTELTEQLKGTETDYAAFVRGAFYSLRFDHGLRAGGQFPHSPRKAR
jgi:peptidyl-prolyl cis-trans isomerase D